MALMASISTSSASARPPLKWVTSWTGSVQGPYPIGNPSAQPDLRFAFPTPETGARDQSFRLIVRPDLWSRQVRLRFSNALGARSVTFDGVHVGLQRGAAVLVAGSNQPVSFAGKRATTVAPGMSVWSDAVSLPFVRDPAAPELLGRKLAVSFHVAGESGPMTWHAKALTTSYLTAPGAGAKGAAEDEQEFPFSTASWYFLDALDMMAPANACAIVALGDSITDGTVRQKRTPSARHSISSSARAACLMGWPISMQRHSIRRPAAYAPNSCPTAQPADLATRSIQTGWAIWLWAWRSIWTCSGHCRSCGSEAGQAASGIS
jgi:hypothetical protein